MACERLAWLNAIPGQRIRKALAVNRRLKSVARYGLVIGENPLADGRGRQRRLKSQRLFNIAYAPKRLTFSKLTENGVCLILRIDRLPTDWAFVIGRGGSLIHTMTMAQLLPISNRKLLVPALLKTWWQ